MRLVHFSAWAFTTDGTTLIQLKGAPMFYATTQEARGAASKLGLIVLSDGEVGLSEDTSELVSAFGMGDSMNASYEIEYRIFVRPEDFSPNGHFDDETAADILKSAESNEWAWAAVEVQAVAVFASGAEVIGSDFLGGCSYGSENEFKAEGGYFEDMKIEALSDLMGKL